MKSKSTESMKKLQERVTELENGWKRTQADFINFKNRIEQEKKEWSLLSKLDAALSFLPIYDNIELAFSHLSETAKSAALADPELKNWFLGIEYIKKQFEECLKEIGLERVPTEGAVFDPEIMEAVATQEGEEDKVVKEVQSGWRSNQKLVRPAKVIVGKKTK